jgi:hypothetical protein
MRTLLIYKIAHDLRNEDLKAAFQSGINYVTSEYTFLKLGIVCNDDGTAEYVPGYGTSKQTRIVHTYETFPNFAEIEERGAPISMFDDRITSAVREPVGRGAHPIFTVRTTRIRGGLILCLSIAQQAMDGTAMACAWWTFALGCTVRLVDFQGADWGRRLGRQLTSMYLFEIVCVELRHLLASRDRTDTIPSGLSRQLQITHLKVCADSSASQLLSYKI